MAARKNIPARQVTPVIGLDRILAHVEELASQPFQNMLAHAIFGGQRIPWAKFAKAHPDQYVRAVRDLALLAGYTPEAYKQAASNVVIIERMSDNDLVQALAVARAQLAAIMPVHAPVTIEHNQTLDSSSPAAEQSSETDVRSGG